MSYIDDLNQAATEALAASSSATDSAQIMFDVANGGETTTVTTANGEVKTLAKAIKDIIDSIEAGVEAPQVEPQTLSAGQTTVSLTTMTTEGIAVYVEGSREFDFTVVNSTDFDFGQSFPDGTRIWVVKREVLGTFGEYLVTNSDGVTDTLENWFVESANAKLYRDQAEQFKDQSVVEADRAETARDAAASAGNIHATVAEGESTNTDGDFFWVVSGDDLEILELWVMGASSASDTGKRTYSKKSVDELTAEIESIEADALKRTEHENLGLDYHFALTDIDGNILGTVSEDGSVKLVGMDAPLQSTIKDIFGTVSDVHIDKSITAIIDANYNTLVNLNEDASIGLVGGEVGGGDGIFKEDASLAILDANQNIIAYLDDKSGLHLEGLSYSVQHIIKGLSPADESTANTDLASTRGHEFKLSDASLALLTNTSVMSGYKLAPYCSPMLPHSYSVPTTFIDTLALTQPEQRIVIDTPYFDDDEVVHPALVEFYNGFRGYRYWMAITPYASTHDIYENPCIYGSNDMVSFDLLSDFNQPLADKPSEASSHNSDVGITYDPMTGQIICFWRKTVKSPESVSSLWCRKTIDGRHWTEAEMIAPEVDYSTNAYLSPSYVYNPSDSLWHRYTSQDSSHIRHATSTNFNGPWTEEDIISTPPSFNTWHTDVRFVGDKMVMIINDMTNTDNLYLGISADGYNWTFNETPLLSGDFLETYKATFLPEFNAAGELSLKVMWTSSAKTVDDSDNWRLFVANTNSISI